MVVGHDAVQVVQFAFEPAGRKRQAGQARQARLVAVDAKVQFDPPVRARGGEQVDGAQRVAVVVARDQRKPVPVADQSRGVAGQVGGGGRDRDPVVPGGFAIR